MFSKLEIRTYFEMLLLVGNDIRRYTSPKSDLHLGVVGRRTLESRGMLVEAMPSVMKASAEVSLRALREVDRLNENPENASGQRRQ